MKINPIIASLTVVGLLTGCGGDDNKSSSSSSSLSSSLPASSAPASSVPASSEAASSMPASSLPASSSSSVAPELTGLTLNYVGRYSAGEFGVSAAEIPAFDPASKRAFVVNAKAGVVDVLNMADPTAPVKLGTLDANGIAAGAVVNSVSVHNGTVALAIEAAVKTDPGFIALFKASDLTLISHVGVGAQPDMLTFSPDGKYLLVANEGEPSDDYQVDPEGSVSIVNLANLQSLTVTTANFQAYNGREAELRATGVRIYGPGANAAKDFEPEYIAVSADSSTAWVVLQENNALAKISIATATVTDVLPLGYKDHAVAGKGLDASDTDALADIKTWGGLRGLYLPDAMASFSHNGATYLITANEGDARAWGETNDAYWAGDETKGFVEEFRVKHLVHKSGFDRRLPEGDLPPQLRDLAAGALLNPDVFGYCGAIAGDPKACRDDNLLGRLSVTWTLGYRTDTNGNPVLFNASGVADPAGDRLMYDALYSFGGRSISIWDDKGVQVWDSGDHMEQYFAGDDCKLGAARNIPCKTYFNSNHEEGSTFDNRSDNKGPEPEGVVIGVMGDKTFAFIGLERIGGVMVYNVTNPQAPVFVDYLNSREDWTTEDPSTVLAQVGDLGPEGLTFVNAADSPNGKALLIVGNEVSGTTSVYEVAPTFAQ